MMDLSMNFDMEECIVTAMQESGLDLLMRLMQL